MLSKVELKMKPSNVARQTMGIFMQKMRLKITTSFFCEGCDYDTRQNSLHRSVRYALCVPGCTTDGQRLHRNRSRSDNRPFRTWCKKNYMSHSQTKHC